MENNTELSTNLKENAINFENLPAIDQDMSNIPAKYLIGYNDVNLWLKGFELFLNVSKRVNSDNTKRTYISNTKQFLVWCNKTKFGINAIKKTLTLRNLVICYEHVLGKTDLARNSKAIKQMSIKKFFEYYAFINEKDFELNLQVAFSSNFVTSSDQNAYRRQTRINKEVFDAIKEQADLGTISDRWIFFFLAFGLRRSEIANARVSDVSFINREINIYQTKTGQSKKLPLPIWVTSEDLLDRKNVYLVANESKRSAKTKFQKKVSEQYIYSKILGWRNKTEFKSVEITPHSFRRYFVNNLLRQGASDSNIAKLSGHQTLTMVARYGYDIALDANPVIQNNQVKY